VILEDALHLGQGLLCSLYVLLRAGIDGRIDFGTYVALRSPSGDVEVQVRLAPAGNSGLVSRVRGVAIRVDGHILVIDHAPDAFVIVEPFEATGFIATDNDAYLLRDDTVVGVFWPDIYTSISVTGIGRNFVNLYVTLDADRAGMVAGLLGDGDGNDANDLALPDGTRIENTFNVVHGEFRDAWRVSGEASLAWFVGHGPTSVSVVEVGVLQRRVPRFATRVEVRVQPQRRRHNAILGAVAVAIDVRCGTHAASWETSLKGRRGDRLSLR